MRKIIKANEGWSFSRKRMEGFTPVSVPGELFLQGHEIFPDTPHYMKKTITWNSEWEGKDVILKFNGVYSDVIVYTPREEKDWRFKILKTHYGGFTPFEVNITDEFNDGECVIILRIVDPRHDTSNASGYAFHPISGILRDVELEVLPKKRILSHKLTSNFNHDLSEIKLDVDLKKNYKGDVKMNISGHGFQKDFIISEDCITLDLEKLELWSDEFPNLYKITLSNEFGDEIIFNYGFRKVEIKGTRMLINNKRIFLRGVNRHDLDSELGRTGFAKNDERDIKLLKEMNVNFVRASHYPTTKRFLDLCDEHGIFVENESPTCFIGVNHMSPYYLEDFMHSHPDYKDKFISQFWEMIDYSYNHPSIIIWSIGNENYFGSNFEALYQESRKLKDNRAIIYSFPGAMDEPVDENHKDSGIRKKVYDILSAHYTEWTGELDQWGVKIKDHECDFMPVIYDEFAHIPAYNLTTLREDCYVKGYWGHSIKYFMQRMYESNSVLGGAIWCYQDEQFVIPENIFNADKSIREAATETVVPVGRERSGRHIGYGPWGVIDRFGNKKDEFFFAKKAYSPILIDEVVLYDGDDHLIINNRHSFKDFENDISVYIRQDNKIEKVSMHIDPMSKIKWKIPAKLLGKTFEIIFKDSHTEKIIASDIVVFISKEKEINILEHKNWMWEFENAGLKFRGIHHVVKGEKEIAWDNYVRAVDERSHIVEDNAKCISIKNTRNQSYADIKMSKSNNDISFSCDINISSVKKTEEYNPWSYEAGLLFEMDESFEEMEWRRIGLYNDIPENNIGALTGKLKIKATDKFDNESESKNKNSLHNRIDYYLYGDEKYNKNNDLQDGVRSAKENVKMLRLSSGNKRVTFNFTSETHTRIFKDNGKTFLAINGFLDYPDIAWGNKCKRVLVDKTKLNFIVNIEDKK